MATSIDPIQNSVNPNIWKLRIRLHRRPGRLPAHARDTIAGRARTRHREFSCAERRRSIPERNHRHRHPAGRTILPTP